MSDDDFLFGALGGSIVVVNEWIQISGDTEKRNCPMSSSYELIYCRFPIPMPRRLEVASSPTGTPRSSLRSPPHSVHGS